MTHTHTTTLRDLRDLRPQTALGQGTGLQGSGLQGLDLQGTDLLVYRYTGLQVPWSTGTLVYRYTGLQVHWSTGTLSTGTLVYRYPGLQVGLRAFGLVESTP